MPTADAHRTRNLAALPMLRSGRKIEGLAGDRTGAERQGATA
jgi:hypothetical protein